MFTRGTVHTLATLTNTTDNYGTGRSLLDLINLGGGGLLQSFKGWHPHCAAGFTECFWLRVFGFLKEWCLKVLAQRQTPEFRPQRGRCIVVKRQRLHSSDFGLAASAFCQLSISLALGGPPCSEPKVTSNPAQGAQAHPVKKDYGCQRWALWLRFRESGKLQSFLFFSFLLFLGGVGWGGGNNIWNAHFNEVFFFLISLVFYKSYSTNQVFSVLPKKFSKWNAMDCYFLKITMV